MTLFSPLRIALAVAALLSIVSPAQAYLDPGTGSMIISAVIGVAAALGLGLRMFWYRVVGLFRGTHGNSRPGEAESAPPAKE